MTIISIIFCVIIIIILLKIHDNVKNKKTYEMFEQFPSYPTYPLIGNLYVLFGSMKNLLTRIDRGLEGYDRLVFWFYSKPVMVFMKHDDIVRILTHNDDRDMLGFADELFGYGIVNAKYKEWKISRKIFAQAFTSEMLAKYTDVFNEKSLDLADSFKQVADTGQVTDVLDYLMKNNIDTIVENALGVSLQAMGDKGEKFGHATLKGLHSLVERVQAPWLHPSFMYRIYLKFSGKKNLIKYLNYLPEKILQDKLDAYRNANHECHDADSPKTILDLLLQGSLQNPSFTKTRIKDELIHIIAAAAETSSMTVSFLMLMLAIHQDIQQKVYEEITDVFRNSGDTFPSDHSVDRLKYLEQCINETNRMYTPAIATIRRTHKDCMLKDNKIIPANTLVFLAFHWAHRDKEMYENPFEWDPENFGESAVQSRPKSSLLSFGYGARACIGTRYAMISMKIQITHILRNYHLSTDIKEFTRNDINVDIAVRSKLGYPIKFTTRHGIREKIHQK